MPSLHLLFASFFGVCVRVPRFRRSKRFTHAAVVASSKLQPFFQRMLAQEARLAKRRIQNRTRQINGDGMMDEILAGGASARFIS